MNKALYVERWKAAGDLLGRLSLIADELEHFTISVFHQPTVLVVNVDLNAAASDLFTPAELPALEAPTNAKIPPSA